MAFAPQLRIPATYMRGGTSKGVFFRLEDLPEAARVPGPARDRLLQRVIGSPDPYGKQTDGMGGATSSTSKCVIVSPSARLGHDVDYLYGQVGIDTDFVDWSGNCGNLSTAAGDIDLNVRALSMGKLHHAMMGTASVAIATAAAVPGTLVNLAAGRGMREAVRFGHPSGILRVGAAVAQVDGRWTVTKAVMSRSARILMEGAVRVPA